MNVVSTILGGQIEKDLVDFDYETWRNFGLNLYWPAIKGSLDLVWPMKILCVRSHPVYQMVGLVKFSDMEEVVVFSKETGRDCNGRHILMDLDSFFDPLRRATTFLEISRCVLKLFWDNIKILKMMILKDTKRYFYSQNENTKYN